MGIEHSHLVIDSPADGPWNMAVDEALLNQATDAGTATLRFYAWRQPTLSLGYFQSHQERAAHPQSQDAPLVRRMSGGGAILHDTELTYSLALPLLRGDGVSPRGLYDLVQATLLEALGRLGVGARRPAPVGQTLATPEPFLCFERRTAGDIVLDDSKIAGSAQRRQRDAILQHGSILLKSSALTPHLAGIAELCHTPADATEIIQVWSEMLAERLSLHWTLSALNDEVQDKAEQLAETKYGHDSWTLRR